MFLLICHLYSSTEDGIVKIKGLDLESLKCFCETDYERPLYNIAKFVLTLIILLQLRNRVTDERKVCSTCDVFQ